MVICGPGSSDSVNSANTIDSGSVDRMGRAAFVTSGRTERLVGCQGIGYPIAESLATNGAEIYTGGRRE